MQYFNINVFLRAKLQNFIEENLFSKWKLFKRLYIHKLKHRFYFDKTKGSKNTRLIQNYILGTNICMKIVIFVCHTVADRSFVIYLIIESASRCIVTVGPNQHKKLST